MQVICYGSAPRETKLRNRGKLTKDGEEAKQRRDFRRNPLGAQEHTPHTQFSLKSRELGFCATPPYTAIGYGGVHKLPDPLISLHRGESPMQQRLEKSRAGYAELRRKMYQQCLLYTSAYHVLLRTRLHPGWPRVIRLFSESPT